MASTNFLFQFFKKISMPKNKKTFSSYQKRLSIMVKINDRIDSNLGILDKLLIAMCTVEFTDSNVAAS